ncbi:MAG: hypothetical protein ACREHF_07505 [Rhizomicrobium sp.]
MKWRVVVAIAASVTALAGGAVVFFCFWGFSAYYSPAAPPTHYAPPRDLAQAQRDDLDYLRKFLYRDWSYTPRTRARAGAVIDAALAGPLPLSRGKFELNVARVVAIADNGHTNVSVQSRSNRLNRVPVRFYLFTDGLYVVRALPQAETALGKKVIAFDGNSFAQVRRVMNRYVGGTAEERDARLPFALEAPQLLHAAGMANRDDAVTLTVESANGEQSDVPLRALPPDPKGADVWPWNEMQPAQVPGTSKAWRAALHGASSKMLLFADPARAFVMLPLPRQHAWYLRYNQNYSTATQSIGEFSKRAEAALLVAKPAIVIIDMRFNGGGDYTTTASFMRNLPLELPRTKFYVLEGSDTFSAGMTAIAFLKQAGGARTILVGSRPGDRIRFHSEGSDFCLPYSKICMVARTAIHDYSTTHCRPLSECFVLDWLYPVAIKSFEPDLPAPLTWKALSADHDPALEAIFPGQRF